MEAGHDLWASASPLLGSGHRGLGLPIGDILGLYWGYMGIMEKKMETTIMDDFFGLGFRSPGDGTRCLGLGVWG